MFNFWRSSLQSVTDGDCDLRLYLKHSPPAGAGQGAPVGVRHVDVPGSGLAPLGPESGCSPGLGHLWLRSAQRCKRRVPSGGWEGLAALFLC